jgi:hypothetical protein
LFARDGKGAFHAETRRRGGFVAIHDSLKAIAEEAGTEVDEQSYREVQKSQIRKYLLPVGQCQLFDGLQLDDDQAVDQQIDPEATIETDALVLDRYPFVTLDRIATFFELTRKQNLINGLEETRSEVSVNADGSIDDLTSDDIDVTMHFRASATTASPREMNVVRRHEVRRKPGAPE